MSLFFWWNSDIPNLSNPDFNFYLSSCSNFLNPLFNFDFYIFNLSASTSSTTFSALYFSMYLLAKNTIISEIIWNRTMTPALSINYWSLFLRLNFVDTFLFRSYYYWSSSSPSNILFFSEEPLKGLGIKEPKLDI